VPNIKYYLAAYNAVAFIFWMLYLISFIASGFVLSKTGLLLLNIAQGLAVLEILHAILKWVKSPVSSTIAQVTSRLLVVVLINVFINDQSLSAVISKGIFICSLAWGITELVRYSFYFLSLFGKQPYALLWMRYTFFIVLYPLGVTGEWFILAAPLVVHGISFNAYTVFLVISFASYAYYFPILYGYMWKQRRAKL
jgi:very-long-chain (3R)-3-hydroxyacyl-CoA dehydratase